MGDSLSYLDNLLCKANSNPCISFCKDQYLMTASGERLFYKP